MDPDADWLTWPQAAEFVGCPVPTIDWHTRTGRIEKRPRVGTRPSLKRSSVEEFAVWWREREAERERRRQERVERAERLERHRARAEELGIRPTRVPALQNDSTGWVTTLGVARVSVMRLVTDAGCRTEQVGHRWWIDEGDVRALAVERSRWVSFADAAKLVGCSEGAIKTAANAGRIRRREEHRSLPSLERQSVVEFAEEWSERKQKRAERATPVTGPPDDGDVWLDSTTAGLVLGVSRSRICQLAQREQLPALKRGGRYWVRRSHMEQAAAARAKTGARNLPQAWVVSVSAHARERGLRGSVQMHQWHSGRPH